ALIYIVNLVPVRVRANGYAHKLPSLRPIAVQGYDLVDTELVFETGAVAHLLTGWALPNTAWSTTVQSGRLICSEGLIDLGLDSPGLHEIQAEGVFQVNPLFRNFQGDNLVSGYGISSPGRLYEQILSLRNGKFSAAEKKAAVSAITLGLFATLVIEGAEKSLADGRKLDNGATLGAEVDLRQMARDQIGAAAAREYGLG